MNNHNIEREVKLEKLRKALEIEYLTVDNPDHKPIYIKRFNLVKLIMRELKIIDRHCVSGWIKTIMVVGYISPNPTSEFTRNGKHVPSDDSRYFINTKVTHHPQSIQSVRPEQQNSNQDNSSSL
jgi:hypothetical protein